MFLSLHFEIDIILILINKMEIEVEVPKFYKLFYSFNFLNSLVGAIHICGGGVVTPHYLMVSTAMINFVIKIIGGGVN